MSSAVPHYVYRIFFFFNDTATTEIYTLSLHDALPIFRGNGADGPGRQPDGKHHPCPGRPAPAPRAAGVDRKSTRLNSSHGYISYAVFCLKKKQPLTRRRQPVHLARRPPLPLHVRSFHT